MELLAWVENSAFAVWVRESPSLLAYTLFLSFHTIGLAFLVGFSSVTALRLLGVARRVPLAPLANFFPLMHAAFWVNAVTGLILLSTAPVSFFRNPTFYVKLLAIALAIVCLRKIRRQVFGNLATVDTKPLPANAKMLAGAVLAFWSVAIVAGRLTAYSRPVIIATVSACLVLGVLVLAGSFLARSLGRGEPARQRA